MKKKLYFECIRLIVVSFFFELYMQIEEYEWGNPKAKNLPDVRGDCAEAAHFWRKKLQGSKESKGIFDGWSFILKTSRDNDFRTVIGAGGGNVIDVFPK